MADTPSVSTYSAFWIFRLDPAFHRISDDAQRLGKAEFLSAIEHKPKDIEMRGCYSLVGLRDDADLMFWIVGTDLDSVQQFAVSLRHTGLGAYLTSTATYIGVVSPARYDPGHLPAFMLGATPKNFISVYPFIKTTEWYLLPYESRRELMAEHGLVGRKFAVPRDQLVEAKPESRPTSRSRAAVAEKAPAAAASGGVLANTVDSFGLGDFEFILANESNDPAEISRMMEALRATEVRRYTQRDTPIFLGRRRDPADALSDL